uniref:SH2 domain-containing protein n=1 Tax=Macrostomum lignano TaxID=282301 RepID=A0A1I8JQE8_9PLAT
GTAAAAGHRADSNVVGCLARRSPSALPIGERRICVGCRLLLATAGAAFRSSCCGIGLAEYSNDEKFQLDSVLQRVHAAQAMDEKRKDTTSVSRLQTGPDRGQFSFRRELQSGLLYKCASSAAASSTPFSKRYVCQPLPEPRLLQLRPSGAQSLCSATLCHLEFVTEAQSGEWFLAEVRRRTERALLWPRDFAGIAEEGAKTAHACARLHRSCCPKRLESWRRLKKPKGAERARQRLVPGQTSARPPPASETRQADSGQRNAKKKKKDKKRKREREGRSAKQKQKEEKREKTAEGHSPESCQPPPAPPPPVELTVIEPSAGVIVEADCSVNSGSGRCRRSQFQTRTGQEELGEPRNLKLPPSSGPVAQRLLSPRRSRMNDEDGAAAAAAEADKASTSGTSNRCDSQVSVARRFKSSKATSLLFLKLSAPPRPPPRSLRSPKRAIGGLFWTFDCVGCCPGCSFWKNQLRVCAEQHQRDRRLLRGIRASGEVEISAKFSSGVLTVLVHRCRNLARIDGRQPSPYVKTLTCCAGQD